MIKGMDVSKWNGKGNWDVARSKGVEFAYIRLGSIDDVTGKCYLDYLLQDHLSEALRTNTPFGYYFYTRPKYSAQVQGDFINEQLFKLPEAQLEFAIDAEQPGVSLPATTVFLSDLDSTLLYPTLMYSRQTFWDFNVLPDPLWPTKRLWAARYNTALTSPWSDGKYAFRDWKDWWFWQVTDKAPATDYGFPGGPTYSATLDLNYFNGTLEEFQTAYSLVNPLEKLESRIKALEDRWALLSDNVRSIRTTLENIK